METVLTRQSCERIGLSRAWNAQDTGSAWPVFGAEAPVARRLPPSELPKLVLRLGEKEKWCGRVNLANAIQIVRRSAEATLPRGDVLFLKQIEWPSTTDLVRRTEIDFSVALNVLDDETEVYIQRLELRNAVAWLQSSVSAFFPGTEYEIGVLPAEDGEDAMLALRVYGAMSAPDFREKRHAICRAMLDAGHRGLYDVISIFQRRTQTSGRQVFSYYCAVLTY